MTEAEMLALWAYSHEKWPNYPLPPLGSSAEQFRHQAWMDELADLPGDLIRSALSTADLSGREFFPPLGLVRRAALALARAQRGEPEIPGDDEAWAEIMRAVANVGYMAGMENPSLLAWSHPAVADSVKAIGWRELCLSTEPAVLRAQWRGFYASAAARHRSRQDPPAPAIAALTAGRAQVALGDGRG